MLSQSDWWSTRLVDNRVHWGLFVAQKRQDNAVERGRPPLNGAPVDYAAALGIHQQGMWGECATMIFASPCTWNYFREGNIHGVPEIVVDDKKLDAKTRRLRHHKMPVQKGDDPAWYYVLADITEFPIVHLTSWCLGGDGMLDEYWDDPQHSNRPAFWVPWDARCMRPMRELRVILHGHGAP